MNPTADANLFDQDNKEELMRKATKGKWQEVIEIYKNNPTVRTTKISSSGDTALHMAISNERADVVEELVDIIVKAKTPKRDATATTINKPGDDVTPHEMAISEEQESSTGDRTLALEIQNDLGNTPLHLAAYIGSAKMCKCIARNDPAKLLRIRNQVTETPMFLAVVHGKKDAFFCMLEFCENDDQAYKYCRRKSDGRTILHSAISGEDFDLAYFIIRRYPKFQTARDEHGFTPLHLLAGMPSCFKSGRPMNFLYKFIYESIPVKTLQYPENSGTTSLGIPQRLSNITRAPKDHTVQKTDAENPNSQQIVHENAIVPKNYLTCFLRLKHIFKTIGALFGKEKKHEVSLQLVATKLDGLTEMLGKIVKTLGADNNDEKKEDKASMENKKKESALFIAVKPSLIEMVKMVQKIVKTPGEAYNDEKKEDEGMSALLIAGKHGITEMVEMILDKFPTATHDQNTEGKNIVLLAVENRQPHIYQFLQNQNILKESIFYKTDKQGNSALHIAAKLGSGNNWLLPDPALQMQWEVKWYQFVEKSMPRNFFARHNDKGETAWDIFSETHEDLVTKASKWLNETSQSCSVVSVLIATVAFTTSASVPGGVNSASGRPVLSSQPAFNVFAMASLVALSFSIASVVMFMVFFTSRYRERDFGSDLPTKLLVELTSMLISIAAVLVSFCAGHFFVIQDNFRYTAFSLYAVTLFPVAIYAFWQIPVYTQYAMATWNKTPQRIYEHD